GCYSNVASLSLLQVMNPSSHLGVVQTFTQGSLSFPHRPALEALHFPAEPPPPVRGERVLPPDLPLRVALGRVRLRRADRRPAPARRSAERRLLPLHRPLLRRPLPDRIDPRGQLLGGLLPRPPARESHWHRAGARRARLRL